MFTRFYVFYSLLARDVCECAVDILCWSILFNSFSICYNSIWCYHKTYYWKVSHKRNFIVKTCTTLHTPYSLVFFLFIFLKKKKNKNKLLSARSNNLQSVDLFLFSLSRNKNKISYHILFICVYCNVMNEHVLCMYIYIFRIHTCWVSLHINAFIQLTLTDLLLLLLLRLPIVVAVLLLFWCRRCCLRWIQWNVEFYTMNLF